MFVFYIVVLMFYEVLEWTNCIESFSLNLFLPCYDVFIEEKDGVAVARQDDGISKANTGMITATLPHDHCSTTT